MVKFKKYAKKLNTEEGATLVELLAAIAILALFTSAFLALFVQAGNTNNRTDKVNEATLLAQGEMEHVMYWNQGNSLDEYPTGERVHEAYDIHTDIRRTTPDDFDIEMYIVIIEVKEKGGNGHAQMETWLPIKEGTEKP